MLTVHPYVGARDAPQVFAVIRYGPVMLTAPSVMLTPPMLEMVTDCEAETLPVSSVPKIQR